MAAKKVDTAKAAPKADATPAADRSAAPRETPERGTPVRARPVVMRPKPKAKEPPDLVLVRALERGQYGLDIDIIIRNPGEVFEMATSAMRKWPLAKGEHPVEGAVIIETDKGQFELPGWVELVEADEKVTDGDLESHGHQSVFRNESVRNTDVL